MQVQPHKSKILACLGTGKHSIDPVNYINEFLPWEYRAIIDAQKSAGDEKAKINQE
jgi:hypothetical protein